VPCHTAGPRRHDWSSPQSPLATVEGDRARPRPGVGQVRCPEFHSASFVLFRQQRRRGHAAAADVSWAGRGLARRRRRDQPPRREDPVGQLPIGCNYTRAAETYCDVSSGDACLGAVAGGLEEESLDPVEAVPCEQRSLDLFAATPASFCNTRA